MLREDAHDVLRKAALQLHIGAQSGASPGGNEGFREFEADLSALLYFTFIGNKYLKTEGKIKWKHY